MKKLFYLLLSLFILSSCGADVDFGLGGSSSQGPSLGKGGSLARFALAGNHLYCVNGRNLKTFDISDRNNPIAKSTINLNVDVETIFRRDANTLFIGSTTGMLIYDISAAPIVEYVSTNRHVVSCDPVVADQQYAYVTLHSDDSDMCFRTVNRLEIIDISDLSNPEFVHSMEMVEPYGLAIYGDTLFVCDNGLKVLDVADPESPVIINAITGIPARDIIMHDNLLIVMSTNGLTQYRYKNRSLIFQSVL